MTPKRYKLKKDLPTFKEGDEFIRYDNGNLIEIKPNGVVGVCAYSASTLEKFPNILTDWFEEIRPAEPLIETADARYIVKLWASTNLVPSNSNEIEVCQIDSPKGTITQFYSDGLYIQFFGRVAPDAIHGRCYTIDELCGEEE